MVKDVGNIVSGAQRAQLLSLQKTTRQLGATSLRLATGQKVHSALDNPVNFFLSRSLQNRANDLDRLLDGIGQNIRAIETADHGVKAELKILDLAEAYLKDIEQKYLNDEVSTNAGPPDNETYVTFTGAGNFSTYIPGQDGAGTVTVTGNNQVEFSGNLWKRTAFNYTVTPDTVLIFEFRSTLINEVSTIGFDNDQNFNNDNRRFWINGTQTTGITYAAPTPTFQYNDPGNWQRIEIPVGTFFTGTFSHLAFVSDDDAAPFGNSAYRNITLREGPQQSGSQIGDGAVFEEEYAKIVDQLDQIAKDANYRGINLLKSDDMTSVFNETRTSTLVTKGMDGTRAGLGLTIEDFNSVEAVRVKIGQVRAAREKLRAFGSTLETNLTILQTRDVFTRETVNIHRRGASDLTDADLNEEGATMLALQTMQQLATTVLAIRPANILNVLA